MDNFWLGFIIALCAAIVTLVPLGIKLYRHLSDATNSGDWSTIITLLIKLMGEAKDKFEHGAEKKEWVMGQLRVIAHELNYNLDEEAVSKLIDAICDLGKHLYQ